MAKNIVLPIPRTDINATTFNGTYLPINPTGLPEACSMIRIHNVSDKDVFISYDGTTSHDFLAQDDSLVWNFQANSAPGNYTAKLAKGTIIYVLATAGTGFVFLSGFYQPYS